MRREQSTAASFPSSNDADCVSVCAHLCSCIFVCSEKMQIIQQRNNLTYEII